MSLPTPSGFNTQIVHADRQAGAEQCGLAGFRELIEALDELLQATEVGERSGRCQIGGLLLLRAAALR